MLSQQTLPIHTTIPILLLRCFADDTMHTILLHQYQTVLGAREALLNYCDTLQPEHLLQPLPGFNNSSMQSLMVHVANCYIHWLVRVGQGQQRHFFKSEEFQDVSAIRTMYAQVDVLVNEFLQTHRENPEAPATFPWDGVEPTISLTPLQIFTHGITHEFHHKGQVLIMSRQLGYIPVDTDAIRTN